MDYYHPTGPGCMQLARAWVCPQPAYTQRFCPVEGLRHGTIFPELVREYVPEPARPGCPREVAR